jgi:hypothetical protein
MKNNIFFIVLLVILIIYFINTNTNLTDFIKKPFNHQATVGYNHTPEENSTNIGFVKPEHRLLKIFDSISSSNKIKLDGTCQRFSFTKHTIDTNIEEYVTTILKEMINSLNTISSSEYYLKDIENVYAMMNQKNQKRFIIDFFIYDVRNYYTVRLVTDIAIIQDETYLNYLNVYSGSNQILMNKYDVKHRSSGILFDSKMFDENIDNYFDTYYKSHFKLLKPTDDLSTVYHVNTLRNTYLPSSISNKSIDELNKKDLSSYLEMYLPENQNTIKSPMFCEKYSLDWDNKGIFRQKQVGKNDCYFHNEQTFKEMNQPYFSPGVITQRSNDHLLVNRGNISSSL